MYGNSGLVKIGSAASYAETRIEIVSSICKSLGVAPNASNEETLETAKL